MQPDNGLPIVPEFLRYEDLQPYEIFGALIFFMERDRSKTSELYVQAETVAGEMSEKLNKRFVDLRRPGADASEKEKLKVARQMNTVVLNSISPDRLSRLMWVDIKKHRGDISKDIWLGYYPIIPGISDNRLRAALKSNENQGMAPPGMHTFEVTDFNHPGFKGVGAFEDRFAEWLAEIVVELE